MNKSPQGEVKVRNARALLKHYRHHLEGGGGAITYLITEEVFNGQTRGELFERLFRMGANGFEIDDTPEGLKLKVKRK